MAFCCRGKAESKQFCPRLRELWPAEVAWAARDAGRALCGQSMWSTDLVLHDGTLLLMRRPQEFWDFQNSKSYGGMNGGQARAHQSDPWWSTQHDAFGWCRNLHHAHAFKVGRTKEMRKLWALDHGDHAVSCLMYSSCQLANPTLYSGIWIERPLRTTDFLVMRTKRPAVHHDCRCEVKQVHRGEACRCETYI